MKRLMCVAAFAAAVMTGWGEAAKPSVSRIFSDHMVLQRGKPLPVWGTAKEGTALVVTFNGTSAEAVAGADGAWQAVLPAQDVLKVGAEMTVAQKDGTIVAKFGDVLVGDVWLCSGQSNMEFGFKDSIGFKEEVKKAKDFPGIRQVKFEHRRAVRPLTTPCCDSWKVCDEETLSRRQVTAVGYYMAREINRQTGVPIGILDCNWGGCFIEPFIPTEGFARVPSLWRQASRLKERDAFMQTQKGSNDWQRVIGEQLAYAEYLKKCRDAKTEVEYLPVRQNPYYKWDFDLAVQYNAMVNPIVRYPIAGAIWYQGCQNTGNAPEYESLLQALAGGWRAKWGYEFPFYIAQLAAHCPQKKADAKGGDGFTKVREQQCRGAKSIPKSGIVVTSDIGNGPDVHPRNKLDVGLRFARWALHDVYGKTDLVTSGPQFKAMKTEGDKLRVSFDYVAGGLMAADKDPDASGVGPIPKNTLSVKGFAIAGDDRVWHFAEAVIDGDDVVVSSPAVKKPVAVRYAYRSNPLGMADLYNSEGLPAVMFRTDNW